eukprot:TRINITY_DN804_c2_g4_i1.p1 TRINITY_DN804_c2_g4~~TRINITY_DN804_c2_g4_i1.p1  ORF type:complete len:630 (+),score=128.65 TRINITY_DN804_c2_g4_i1:35-1924(+)
MMDSVGSSPDEKSLLIQVPEKPNHSSRDRGWEFAEKGSFVHHDKTPEYTEDLLLDHKKLTELPATAIAGNDITSSCLYVAGLSVAASGKFAPLSLFLVTVVLYFYRNVYAEVGSALPLNGGAYNILLNTTSKTVAALAASLTMLSYVATAVVSGSEAMEYAHDLSDKIDPLWATIALLAFFALLNFLGITESSVVALFIFFVHCGSLLLLIGYCTYWAWYVNNWQLLIENWNAPPMTSIGADIFFGYCSGLLGVSGFETSSNYIEEQERGVFPKTLRNMWVAVAFFNPIISLLSLAMLTTPEIINNQRIVLSVMGQKAAGDWLSILISVDAVMVLSGAVLTAYVGVTGLIHRMALDRLLPTFLLHKNRLRNTNHWIIVSFFITTSSLYLIVNGNVTTLSGVYTVAFLSVMSLFAIGNMLLKYKRSRLPRDIKTQWPFVVLALLSTSVALVGNIAYDLNVLKYFSMYFIVVIAIIFTMMQRISILKVCYYFVNKLNCCSPIVPFLKRQIQEIRDMEMVFFTRTGDLPTLNKAMIYIRDNEITSKLTIIHAIEEGEDISLEEIQKNVAIIDECYPKCRVDLQTYKGKFSPAFVDHIATTLKVKKNMMFMGCPNDSFPHNIGDFGGVRLITH